MTVQNIIQKLEEQPLTQDDLKKFNYPQKVRHIYYSQISQYKTLEELLDGATGVIILIENPNGSIGHFVALQIINGFIEFFDPYGNTLEKVLSLLELKNNSLIMLIKKSKYRYYYNTYQFEKYSNRTQTCGRWCVCRLYFPKLDFKQFSNILKYKRLPKDELVVLLTFLNLHYFN